MYTEGRRKNGGDIGRMEGGVWGMGRGFGWDRVVLIFGKK
jgi:hypothetical protein